VTVSLSVDQVDELLRAWDERLRRMDENLVALESEPIYQILAGKGGKRPVLDGITAKQVNPAVDAVTELFENRERLGNVVAKAKEVRAAISTLTFWDTEEKLAQVVKLLRGASVELGTKVVALSDRSLLDVTYKDVLLEPERLLAEMVKAFERARTVLLAVSRAWESLDSTMTEIEKEMSSLRDLARALAPKDAAAIDTSVDLAELRAAEVELASLRSRVQKDPLGVGDGVEKGILPRLSALRARLVAERATQERVITRLHRARELRRVLAEGHDRAARADAECSRELSLSESLPRPRPVDPSLLLGLDQWFGKLEGAVDNHRWSGAEIGLARWLETAEQYRTTDARALALAEGALGLRSELLGRLSARRAQAAALRAKGLSWDPSLDVAARRAEELLRTVPTPMTEADAAVQTFEAAIVALSARR
jgi:hypothetical protein